MNPDCVQLLYEGALSIVEALNSGKPEGMTDEQWADIVSRHLVVLENLVSEDYMADQDLSSINAAIAAYS